MKRILILAVSYCLLANIVLAQGEKKTYPEPEFSNEVTYLKKDSTWSIVRLEKGSSKMETKTKLGGFAGIENGYILDGERSATRIGSGHSLSFIYSTGASKQRDATRDSAMLANGMDPSMMEGMNAMNDPSSMITLYKAEKAKGQRKILMASGGGMGIGKKMKSADKFTFSVRKIRDGYWELVIDKPLPPGEYAFAMMSYGGMDGSQTLYSFGVD